MVNVKNEKQVSVKNIFRYAEGLRSKEIAFKNKTIHQFYRKVL